MKTNARGRQNVNIDLCQLSKVINIEIVLVKTFLINGKIHISAAGCWCGGLGKHSVINSQIDVVSVLLLIQVSISKILHNSRFTQLHNYI